MRISTGRQNSWLAMSQTCLPEIGLFLRNSAGGANGLAGSAINAGIRIDLVLGITLRNRADRAFTFAGATGNAFAGNGMCHLDILLIYIIMSALRRKYS